MSNDWNENNLYIALNEQLSVGVVAYIGGLSKGKCNIDNTNTRVSRVCFGVSNVQIDWRFDGTVHGFDVITAPTHLLQMLNQ